MSIYSTGAEAYRDTAKWLVAFIPVSTLVAAAVALGPQVLTQAATADSVADWLKQNGWVLVGLGVVAVGAMCIMWSGARVLSTQPERFQDLLGEQDKDRLIKAINEGAAEPYFMDDVAYRNARNRLQASWDAKQQVDDAALQRITGATELLRAWALQQGMGAAFGKFRWALVVGIVLILGGFLLTAGALGPTAVRLDKPTVVKVRVNDAGEQDLRATTGCVDASRSSFLAIGGTWNAPVLRIDGPGCRFAAHWQPRRGQFELDPVSQ